jgi:hypothetical protein
MSFIQRWIESDDAKQAEALKTKTTCWFVLRACFGLAFLAKAAHFALTAAGPGCYLLAALFTAGGLAWLFEGAQGIRARLTERA